MALARRLAMRQCRLPTPILRQIAQFSVGSGAELPTALAPWGVENGAVEQCTATVREQDDASGRLSTTQSAVYSNYMKHVASRYRTLHLESHHAIRVASIGRRLRDSLKEANDRNAHRAMSFPFR